MEEVSNFSPEMAVPITVKMPEPITAPIPRAVSDQGPSVFCRLCSGSSESLISLSIDLVANSCLRSVSAPQAQNMAQLAPKQTADPSTPLRSGRDDKGEGSDNVNESPGPTRL